MTLYSCEEFIGLLRAAEACTDVEEGTRVRAHILSSVRDGRAELDEASVAYVTSVALKHTNYSQAMRSAVTAEDVRAVLEFNLCYFTLANQVHYALVFGWWGPKMACVLFKERPIEPCCPVRLALLASFTDVLRSHGVTTLYIFAWYKSGSGCRGTVTLDGYFMDVDGIWGAPWMTEELSTFLVMCQTAQLESPGWEGPLFTVQTLPTDDDLKARVDEYVRAARAVGWVGASDQHGLSFANMPVGRQHDVIRRRLMERVWGAPVQFRNAATRRMIDEAAHIEWVYEYDED